MTALLAILAATFLAYCLVLLKVTREDGELIRFQRAVIDGQRVTLRNQRAELERHRRTFADIERAIELAAQTIRDYEADPLGWQPPARNCSAEEYLAAAACAMCDDYGVLDGLEPCPACVVEQFRAEIEAFDGGAL